MDAYLFHKELKVVLVSHSEKPSCWRQHRIGKPDQVHGQHEVDGEARRQFVRAGLVGRKMHHSTPKRPVPCVPCAPCPTRYPLETQGACPHWPHLREASVVVACWWQEARESWQKCSRLPESGHLYGFASIAECERCPLPCRQVTRKVDGE